MGPGLRFVSPLLLLMLAAILSLPGTLLAQEDNSVRLDALPPGVTNESLATIGYVEHRGNQLVWTGGASKRMSQDQATRLKALAPGNSTWSSAIDALYEKVKAQASITGSGEKVNLQLRDYPITETLLSMAQRYKLNIVCSKDVKGNVTLQLTDVLVPVALQAILESQGYEYQTIKNPVPGAADVFLVVMKRARIPDMEEVVIPVRQSEPGKAPLEFDAVVTQVTALKTTNGRIVSNADARVLLVQDTPAAIATIRTYIDAVRNNLPPAAIQDDTPRQPTPAGGGADTQQAPAAPVEIKKLYRIQPRMLSNALSELKQILGSRPILINQREGIVMIEETATVHELVADYIKKLNETAPPTPPTTERKDTRVYTLKQAADQVMKGLEPFLTKDVGKIVVNPALNSLIVTDMFPNFTVLERYIRELDATPQQVSIEATVIEATLDDTTDFGLSSFWQRAVGTGTLGYQGRSFNPADTVTAPSAFRSFNTGSYNFGFINGSEWEVAINALTTTTDANILSRPKVVVANNKKAELRVGTEVPYVNVQGGAAGATQGVSFKQINLSMVLTPHIEPGDRIRLEIDFKFDTQQGTANLGGAVGSGQPIVANRSVKTEVYVNDGETLVIGGLYEDRATDTINKVPLLGDLPVLGLLFRDTSTRHQKTDLLFIINPSIVRDAKVVEARAKGRRLWVYRPAAPQIPDWYRDRNYSRLSSGGSGE